MELIILLVEDDELVLLPLEQTLKEQGCDVITASNGVEALKKLEQGPVDVILTDMVMPGLNGLELLKTVKQKYPHIGVILFTAYGDTETVIQALRAGADDYLTKPFQPEELFHCLKKQEEKKNLTIELAKARAHLDRINKPGKDAEIVKLVSDILDGTRSLLDRPDLDALSRGRLEAIEEKAKMIGEKIK